MKDRDDGSASEIPSQYFTEYDLILAGCIKATNSCLFLIIIFLAELQGAKLIRADLDLTLEANALIALVDGIGTGVVICPDQFSAEQQQYLVHQHVRALQALS